MKTVGLYPRAILQFSTAINVKSTVLSSACDAVQPHTDIPTFRNSAASTFRGKPEERGNTFSRKVLKFLPVCNIGNSMFP